MEPTELEPSQLLQIMADFFESIGVHYRVVGSMASMAYGEPRMTIDVDIVAELAVENVPNMIAAFPAPDYYVSEQAAIDAVRRKAQFNIIHLPSGLKVDVIIPPQTDFTASERKRVRKLASTGEYSAWFASPEDVILNKLTYFRISGGASQKHVRDIGGMIKLLGDKLDQGYIETWAEKLNVASEWRLVKQRLDQDNK